MRNGFILHISLTPTVPVWFGRVCFPVSSQAAISLFCSPHKALDWVNQYLFLSATLTDNSTAEYAT